MRIWRTVTGGVALAALLISSGCGRSDDVAASSPAGVNERMESVLRKANTGSFQQRTVGIHGAGSVTLAENGTYNLADRSWAIKLRYTSQPLELLEQMPRWQRLGADVVAVNSRAYISMPSWPKPLRGRWTEMDSVKPSAGPGPGSFPVRSFFPAALTSLQPVAVVRREDGWTLRGRVGAAVAMQALGLDQELLRQKVDVDHLTGSAEVIVEIGPNYAPRQVRLDGNTVSVESGLPESVSKDMAFMRTTAVLADLGAGTPVTAPAEKDLIDPDKIPDNG
ncbi:MAG TPA: hypothetical protein VLL08_05685 [Kineosporiaceae bacterium]|nr:hypothetical protein [Kineosporiaceae bacterium]